jgi:hypothetical protein
MTHFDITLRPRVLNRVWLQTTDRNAPLRAVWIDTTAFVATAPNASNGGDPLCA